MQKYRLHPPFGRRTPTMPIITSRGCPYRCSFCSKSVFGRSHRVNSASYVVDEIKLLVDKFGIKEIKFYDDSFTLNRKRVIEICSLLKKRKLDVQWSCETRVNLVDRGLLSTMENAGCYMIEYGVESGVQKILDNLKKDTSLKQIRDAFRLSHESGIETVAYFMLGSPNETPETIEQTIAFAKNIDPDFAQFSIATPFPGTELYKYAMEANQLPENWMGYVYADLTSISNPAFSSQLLSRSELGNWNRRAYLNFYLRGKYILKRLKKIKNAQDFRTSVIGLRMLLESVV